MDKFGVDTTQSDGTKHAAGGCPRCGCSREKLRIEGDVVMCPNCGSEPFEKGE